jgi:integrase
MRNEATGGSFFSYAFEYVGQLRNPDTSDAYKTVVNKLLAYSADLDFLDINYQLITAYSKHLADLGNCQNTRTKNISTLRTIYREAVKAEVFEPQRDPFLKIKFKKEKTHRIRLSPDEFNLLLNYKGQFMEAKNIFCLQYFAAGVRIADMLMMRWENVRADHLHFVASKTGKLHNPKLPKQALELINKIKPKQALPFDYLFTFMKNKRWASERDRRNEIQARTATINIQLKKIMAEIGINKALSTHSARHSFAENARLATKNDIYAVSKALGHGSINTTQIYFSQGNQADSDSVTDALFGNE